MFINDKGEITGRYYKNHLWTLEQKCFAKGKGYQVYDTPLGKIGILICYDVDFPETCRKLALEGAEIIFIPSAWSVGLRHLWDTFLPSRALENTIFLAGVNRVGKDNSVNLFGRSVIYNPLGKVVKIVEENKECLVVQQIDLDLIYEIRKEFPYLSDIDEKNDRPF